MAEYPTKLRNFKAWSKAMEEGAIVGKPSYGRTRTGSRKATSHKSRKHPRRMRKRTQD